MKQLLLSICAAIICLSAATDADAQTGRFFDVVDNSSVQSALSGSFRKYRIVKQNIPALQSFAASVSAAARGNGVGDPLTIPLPDGDELTFQLTETQTLSQELALQHPDIKTFSGVTDDRKFRLRVTISQLGITGTITGLTEQYSFGPAVNTSPETLLIYAAKDIIFLQNLQCGVEGTSIESTKNKLNEPVPLFGDVSIRTYRLGVAATGEYTTWAGGQANALIQMTTTVNSVNGVYERDLAIHFTLTTNNNIIFTDGTTDPYSTGDPALATLNENQATLDNAANLGSANYDVGIVFCALGSGGLAFRPAACVTANKAKGSAGLNPASFSQGPSGIVFEGTVAHEIGHEFNANHSFAANNGSCGGGNVSPSTGWEPGGGSTIMAYAGTCSGNAYQSNSDLYFHGGNLNEMSTYMTGTATCAATTPNASAAPVINPGPSTYTIPNSVPFKLNADASESESDVLTYTWEQINPIGGTGTATAPLSTATSGPLFRSFPPTTERTRYLPSLASLVGINATTYEVLPTVARTMNFRLTVRDNNPGGGRTGNKDVAVTTLSCNGGPFGFTSQSTGGSFTANGTNTIPLTWNTASTCLTCAQVNIRFSTDGGRSYPFMLAKNIPNNGAYSLIVPNLPTGNGRLMIECSDNIFFNINAADQTITSSCTANSVNFSPSTGLYVANAGNAALNQSLTPQFGTTITSPITGTISSTDPNGTLTVFNSVTSGCNSFNGNITRYDTYTFIPGTTGSYTFNTTGSNGNLGIHLYDSSFNFNDPCRNFLTSTFSYNGTSVSNSTTLTRTLSKNKVYVLVVSSFSSTSPALPASYTIAVTGGTLYTNTPNPGGLNYSYVIVNNATSRIVSIQTTGNMTNTTTFPVGSYNIYGLTSTSTAAALNTTYQGTSFAAFRTAVFNQVGGLCASLSSSSRNVGIASPLPVVLLSFNGRLTDRRISKLFWQTGTERNVGSYEILRSYDNTNFESIGKVAAQNKNGSDYIFYDSSIAASASQVSYKLKINDFAGPQYSGLVTMKLDRTVNKLVVVPNPVTNGIIEADLQLPAGKYDVAITDIAGRLLQTQLFTLQMGVNKFSASVSGLATGVYFIQVRGNNIYLTEKFVKY